MQQNIANRMMTTSNIIFFSLSYLISSMPQNLGLFDIWCRLLIVFEWWWSSSPSPPVCPFSGLPLVIVAFLFINIPRTSATFFCYCSSPYNSSLGFLLTCIMSISSSISYYSSDFWASSLLVPGVSSLPSFVLSLNYFNFFEFCGLKCTLLVIVFTIFLSLHAFLLFFSLGTSGLYWIFS